MAAHLPGTDGSPRALYAPSYTYLAQTGMFHYFLPKAANVSLRLYGTNGKCIGQMLSSQQSAGNHVINLKGTTTAQGSCIAIFTAGNFSGKRVIFIN